MAHLHQKFHHKMAKRDEIGGLDEVAKRDPDPQVFSVVVVTLSPTFTGPASYSTITGDDSTTAQSGIILGAPASQAQTISTTDANTSATAGFDFNTATSTTGPSSTRAATTTSRIDSTSVAAITTPATSAIVATTLLTSSAFSEANTNTAVAAASSSASQSTSSSTQSGLSGAAKVGLAIGLIVLIAAAAIGALLLYSKKKKQHEEHQRLDDEKASFGAAAAARTAMSDQSRNAPAPRLSLRPVSKLLPDLMGGGKKRASQGNPLSTFNQGSAAAGPGRHLTPSPRAASPWERREEKPSAANNPFNDPPNPFADSARAPPPASMTPSNTTNPAVAAGIAGTAAGAGLAAMAASARVESPKPPVRKPPPAPAPASASTLAPASTPSPVPAAAAIPAPLSGRSSPANAPPAGNVYRIQMDFKPSMDDELELRAGQLVRMIHEYDDGWALCTRLDRSQQGVAPRTCLAANPSKPRPTNGPPRPGPNNGRPMGPPPNGRMSPAMGRPMSPGMARPMSPANQSPRMPPQQRSASPAFSNSRPGASNGPRSASPGPGAYNLAPRPLSPGPRPAQKRSMSPGPYGPGGAQRPVMPAGQRRRSNSATNVRERRDSPPGPSKLGPGAGPNRFAGMAI